MFLFLMARVGLPPACVFMYHACCGGGVGSSLEELYASPQDRFRGKIKVLPDKPPLVRVGNGHRCAQYWNSDELGWGVPSFRNPKVLPLSWHASYALGSAYVLI